MSWLNEVEDFVSDLDKDTELGAYILSGQYLVDSRIQDYNNSKRMCRKITSIILLVCLIAIFVKMYFF